MGQTAETQDGNCAARSIQVPDLKDWSACMRELSLHILDAMENSIAADAKLIELTIDKDRDADLLTITIKDNGRGMDDAQLARIFDPFYTTRTTRHVGLGVPLFKAAAERCDGDLTIASELGTGTTLTATFQNSHIDRAPLGNIAGTLMAIILSGKSDVHFTHRVNGHTFQFHTAEIKAELDGIPLGHPAVREWLEDFIAQGEAELRQAARQS